MTGSKCCNIKELLHEEEQPCSIVMTKALNLHHAPPTFMAQSMSHFVPGRSVHTNTILTFIEASSQAAIAVQKLFVTIIQSLESYQVLIYTDE